MAGESPGKRERKPSGEAAVSGQVPQPEAFRASGNLQLPPGGDARNGTTDGAGPGPGTGRTTGAARARLKALVSVWLADAEADLAEDEPPDGSTGFPAHVSSAASLQTGRAHRASASTAGGQVGKAAREDDGDSCDDRSAALMKTRERLASGRPSPFVPLKPLDGEPAKPADKEPSIPVTVTPHPDTSEEEPRKAGAGQPDTAGKAVGPRGSAEAEEPKDLQTVGDTGVPPGPVVPLALLAGLTNRQPTLARSILRRVRIYTPLAVLLGVVFCAVQVLRPLPGPKLAAAPGKAAHTFAGRAFAMPWPSQGQAAAKVVGVGSLGTYGEQKPVPTASVAKVMTAYVVLKDRPLKRGEKGPDVRVDAQAEQDSHAKDESLVALKEGEKIPEYDLLQMMLIPSGNNVARLLARWDAQSGEAFVAKMNDAARELGMSRTVYTDPSGLDAATKSTAADQLRLAEEVMKDDVFREIVRKPSADAGGRHLNNNNDDLLLKPGGLGIKTGSSSPAGGTLMWAARRTVDGTQRMILGVTMDQHYMGGPDANAGMSLKLVKRVSYEMIEDIQSALTSAKIISKGDVVGYADDGLGGRTPVIATRDLKAVGWPGLTTRLTLTPGRKSSIPHSARAGTEIGELAIGTSPHATTVPVALQKDLTKPALSTRLTRLR